MARNGGTSFGNRPGDVASTSATIERSNSMNRSSPSGGGSGNGGGANGSVTSSSAVSNSVSSAVSGAATKGDPYANLPVVMVGTKFRLLRRLGAGAFGEVYEGSDVTIDDPVAIKLEPIRTTRHPHLHREARLYSYLQRGVITSGIPKLRWYGVEGEYNVLVMDLLGPSVEDIFDFCHRQFELKTVYMLVEQIIERLEFMHAMNYLHRDIKPDNFVMGIGRRAHFVYVIDLGLAKRYWDPRSGNHIPFVGGKQLTGTARYVSLSTHLGYQQSRRDDLESVGYVALYLASGSLPWQGMRCSSKHEKYERIRQAKEKTSPAEMCRGLPPVFEKYLKYSRELGFEERPDYDLCKTMFANCLLEIGARDYNYTWLSRKGMVGASDTESVATTLSTTASAVHLSSALSKVSSIFGNLTPGPSARKGRGAGGESGTY